MMRLIHFSLVIPFTTEPEGTVWMSPAEARTAPYVALHFLRWLRGRLLRCAESDGIAYSYVCTNLTLPTLLTLPTRPLVCASSGCGRLAAVPRRGRAALSV